jgi:glycosyltransferase involved in cell wall biosynthesis
MRVLFLTQGALMPSSRFRVLQLVPALEKAGIQCTVLAPNPSVGGDLAGYKLIRPVRELLRPLSVLSRLKALPLIKAHDVVVIQKPLNRFGFVAMEKWITMQKPTVFDLDDAVFHNAWNLEGIQTRRIARWAHHITAGNQYIREALRQPQKTSIIPTVVDVNRYQMRTDPEGPFTLGWTGSGSNLRELLLVKESLAEVLRATKGRLLIISNQRPPKELEDLPIHFIEWSPEVEATGPAEVHVGLMPLRDIPYNRGKCGFKLLQYMARGIPVVTHPIGANAEIVRNHVDGFWAESQHDWTEALLKLSSSKDLRIQMGAAGRSRVEEFYSVQSVVPNLSEIFCRLGSKPV